MRLGTKKVTYEQEMRQSARRLYSSDLGRKVLTHMLGQMGFFTKAETEQEQVIKNFATDLMAEFGFTMGNGNMIIEAILKLPREKD